MRNVIIRGPSGQSRIARSRRALLGLLFCLGAAVPAMAQSDAPAVAGTSPQSASLPPWQVPDIAKLPDDAFGRAARFGHDLIDHTTALIGPDAPDPSKRYSGNGLECSNCHIHSGTTRFAIPLVGIYQQYPAFSARMDAMQSLADRVQDCMERSMNGRRLPAESP